MPTKGMITPQLRDTGRKSHKGHHTLKAFGAIDRSDGKYRMLHKYLIVARVASVSDILFLPVR